MLSVAGMKKEETKSVVELKAEAFDINMTIMNKNNEIAQLQKMLEAKFQEIAERSRDNS